MGILKVELDDKIIEKFKKKAMETYGYKKGSIKLATQMLIKKWVGMGEADWSELRGAIKKKENSVKLQHKLWKGVD